MSNREQCSYLQSVLVQHSSPAYVLSLQHAYYAYTRRVLLSPLHVSLNAQTIDWLRHLPADAVQLKRIIAITFFVCIGFGVFFTSKSPKLISSLSSLKLNSKHLTNIYWILYWITFRYLGSGMRRVGKHVVFLSKAKVLYSHSAFYPDRKLQRQWQISNL